MNTYVSFYSIKKLSSDRWFHVVLLLRASSVTNRPTKKILDPTFNIARVGLGPLWASNSQNTIYFFFKWQSHYIFGKKNVYSIPQLLASEKVHCIFFRQVYNRFSMGGNRVLFEVQNILWWCLSVLIRIDLKQKSFRLNKALQIVLLLLKNLYTDSMKNWEMEKCEPNSSVSRPSVSVVYFQLSLKHRNVIKWLKLSQH